MWNQMHHSSSCWPPQAHGFSTTHSGCPAGGASGQQHEFIYARGVYFNISQTVSSWTFHAWLFSHHHAPVPTSASCTLYFFADLHSFQRCIITSLIGTRQPLFSICMHAGMHHCFSRHHHQSDAAHSFNEVCWLLIAPIPLVDDCTNCVKKQRCLLSAGHWWKSSSPFSTYTADRQCSLVRAGRVLRFSSLLITILLSACCAAKPISSREHASPGTRNIKMFESFLMSSRDESVIIHRFMPVGWFIQFQVVLESTVNVTCNREFKRVNFSREVTRL